MGTTTSLAKLIHQSNMTYVPTKLPVKFFGLPDGNVYLVYGRFSKNRAEKTEIEFVFARHHEFCFDYENELLIPKVTTRCPVYKEMVDKPSPEFEILHIDQKIKTYAEAVELLQNRAFKMEAEWETCA